MIVVRLKKEVPFEKLLHETYTSMPMARRSEWLRKVLYAGFFDPLTGNPVHVNDRVDVRAASSRSATPDIGSTGQTPTNKEMLGGLFSK